MRIPVLIKRLWESLRHGEDMYFPAGRLGYVRRYARWQWRIRFGAAETAAHNEVCSVILLSYRRPHNMAALVRSVARCGFVTRIIVCNNNPEHRINQWIAFRDPRLVLLDNPKNLGTIARFHIARSDDADRFIVIDDDIFLYPEQISSLFAHLVSDPSRPHGVYGQIVKPDGSFIDAVHRVETDIDIINRVYAFTREHLTEFYRLLDVLEFRQPAQLRALTAGDDIVLSFSGRARPRCHDVGEILDCPSEGVPGIAVWREAHFEEYRGALFSRLLDIKPLAGSSALAT